MTLSKDALLAHVSADAAALAATGRAAPTVQVPSCPDWTVQQLLDHTGRVHHWVTGIVRSRRQERLPFASQEGGPEDLAGGLAWFEEGAQSVVAALDEAGEDEPIWNWFMGVAPARFWMQRMALETTVHRWDGQRAAGEPQPIDATLAVAGIDEVVSLFLPRFDTVAKQLSTDASIHLHCTDVEGEWLLRFGPEGLVTTNEHAKGDLAVRGAASDLYLLLWNRVTPERCEVFGDESLLRRWADVVRI
jgi:uncharacterized protein (TIGR03083 family)